jgi:large subunit ribosomal protein L15
MGSGKGRYAGRGVKGQKARSGSHKMSPAFEGGQMPAHMRTGKQRGPHSKDALPIGPFRTFTFALNVRDLDRFDDGAEVTPESLAAAGLIKNTRVDVKILGEGNLTKRLSVTAHRFSATAREKIEQAGGSVVQLREERTTRKRRGKTKAPEQGAAEPEHEAEEPETASAEGGEDESV